MAKPSDHPFHPAAGISTWPGILCWFLGLFVLGAGAYLAPQATALIVAAAGIGLPLLVLVWHRPEFGLLAIVLLNSHFFASDALDLRLPFGGGLDLRDLAFLGIVGLLAFQALLRRSLVLPWWPVGWPLLVFLALALLSSFYSLFFQGTEPNWVLGELRGVSYYALFFVAAWAIKGSKQLSAFLIGLFIIADVTAGVLMAQQFLGPHDYALKAMSENPWWIRPDRNLTGIGTVRIVPPGHVLMYFMMIFAFCLAVSPWQRTRLRLACTLQFLFLNIGLLLTYTRAQWLAAAFALALTVAAVLHLSIPKGVRLVAVVALVLLVSGALAAPFWDRIHSLPVVSKLTTRIVSMGRPQREIEVRSLQWRVFETAAALRAIAEQPLLGVGLGNAYRKITLLQGEARGEWGGLGLSSGRYSRFTRYVHSSYLGIAVKMGILSLMAFLGFCVAFFICGWRLYAGMPKGRERMLVLAVLNGFGGLLAWSVFHSQLLTASSTSTAAIMVGLVGGLQGFAIKED